MYKIHVSFYLIVQVVLRQSLTAFVSGRVLGFTSGGGQDIVRDESHDKTQWRALCTWATEGGTSRSRTNLSGERCLKRSCGTQNAPVPNSYAGKSAVPSPIFPTDEIFPVAHV